MAVGIDIGGTYVKYGYFTEDGRLTREGKVRTPEKFEDLVKMIKELAEGEERVGIAVPGMVRDGHVFMARNLPYLEGNLRERLVERIGKEVEILNDTLAFTYGEYLLREESPEIVVGITLGTDVGMGIVVKGEVAEGRVGGAGEPTFLEDLMGWEKLGERWIRGRTGKEAKVLAKEAEEGNPEARLFWRIYGQRFARLLIVVETILNPDLVVVGGGISGALHLFLPHTRKTLERAGKKVRMPWIGGMRIEKGKDFSSLFGAAFYERREV